MLLNTEVRELLGESALEASIVENNRTGERRRACRRKATVRLHRRRPAHRLAPRRVALDRHGFVLTGRAAAEARPGDRREPRDPLLLETSMPGVLAAGDVRSGSIKRVASAVGEGSMAVRLVHDLLERVHKHPHHVP